MRAKGARAEAGRRGRQPGCRAVPADTTLALATDGALTHHTVALGTLEHLRLREGEEFGKMSSDELGRRTLAKEVAQFRRLARG